MKNAIAVIAYACMLFSTPVLAQELRVLTSFPPAISDTYVELHKTVQKDVELQILNKNTIAAIDEILRGNNRQFDIFWSSSPEAFEILTRNQAFSDAGVCGSKKVGPVEPFALSSVGWARRSDDTLFMPGEWDDLLKPMYRDRIAMARPARSGTTHFLVEQLLLVRGWDAGWRYILELSANLSTLTARSFGVPDGLINKRYGIGLTIDFLAQSKGEVLQFRYGKPIVLVPAHIGILRNGMQKEAACDFMKLVLSVDGQQALLKPHISRIPFDKAVRDKFKDQLPQDIVNALKLSWLDYDAETSSNRYWAVNTLFDLMITETLDERRELWRRYHSLSGHVQPELQIIKRLLTGVIATEGEALSASLIAQGGLRSTALASLGPQERLLVRIWRKRVTTQLEQAKNLLSKLEREQIK